MMRITDKELSAVNKDLVSGFEDYIVYTKRLSDKTREVYSRESRLYMNYLDHNSLVLENTDAKTIEAYIEYRRREDDVDERTSSRILSSLRSFYSFLIDEEIVKNNPAKLIEKPKESEHFPKTISIEEIDPLLDEFKKDKELGIRDYTLFELIYSSGMRISEAISLDINSFNENESTIRVIGKRGKERVVFIGKEAHAALVYYLENIRIKLISKKNKRESALFLNRRGERMTRQAAHLRFHRVSKALGLDATIHTLRHSFASHMLQGGADIRSVQEMLGHSDIKTTQIYTHLDTSSLLNEFDRYSPLGDDDD